MVEPAGRNANWSVKLSMVDGVRNAGYRKSWEMILSIILVNCTDAMEIGRKSERILLRYFAVMFCLLANLVRSNQVVCSNARDWLERLGSEVTYNVLMGTLNLTHSLISGIAQPLSMVCRLLAATPAARIHHAATRRYQSRGFFAEKLDIRMPKDECIILL